MLAERVGVTVPTIAKLESGVATTSMSTMLRVLQSLGFGADIDALAAVDEQGRALQDSHLSRAAPKRAVRK
jgi:transcriptional regulator with XRE-family HTH domain